MERRSFIAAALANGMNAAKPSPLNSIAEAYVRLVLALGVHEPSYVDAYYGPAAWKDEADRAKIPLAAIQERGSALLADLAGTTAGGAETLRKEYLAKQLSSLVTRASMVAGAKIPFDEESKALYDAVEAPRGEAYYRDAATALAKLLPPGDGPLPQRYQSFVEGFAIPAAQLPIVFAAAIAESRARTKKFMTLPAGERFDVEYVSNQPWSAYNWYKGGARSVIQVNTDFPVDLDRVINLAAHEGYPGHHVYNALLEQKLLKQNGWVEFSIYALFSPQSMIAEGTAEYGYELAFSPAERKAFAKDVLAKLAGVSPGGFDDFFAARAAAAKLSTAANEAARLWIDGKIDTAECERWLRELSLMSPGRAKQRLRFFEINRAYVITYTLGQKMVRSFVEKRAGHDRKRQWKEFAALLSSPRLPSGLI